MNCAFHTSTKAIVQCANCQRGLCTSCDHRIKGYPYCQDCIVLGIESLQQRRYYQNAATHRPNAAGRGFLAAMFALFPGGGAIFNRQNVKAIIQFVTIVGLYQLMNLHILRGVFWLAGTAFYLHSIMDAYRTARAISEGASAEENEERFKRAVIKRAPAIGVFLIITGLLVTVSLFRPLGEFLALPRLIPVALVIFGGYLLTRYFKQSRVVRDDERYERRPYQLTSGYVQERTSGHLRDVSKSNDYR